MTASVTPIHDATTVTGDDAGAIHYDAALAIESARVTATGPPPDLLARCPDAERVSARGRAALPGLANTHPRLSRVLARGIYEDPCPPPPFAGGLAPRQLPR